VNDEIKEILDILKETADYPKLNYSSYDKSYNETIDNVAMIKSFACKQLLNYITNLQEEIDRLNNIKDKANKIINTIFEEDNWYKNYDYNDLVDKLKEVQEILGSDTK
jgi:hypothetical protein